MISLRVFCVGIYQGQMQGVGFIKAGGRDREDLAWQRRQQPTL